MFRQLFAQFGKKNYSTSINPDFLWLKHENIKVLNDKKDIKFVSLPVLHVNLMPKGLSHKQCRQFFLSSQRLIHFKFKILNIS